MTERVRPADVLASAGVDEHLDALRSKLKAPRRAKRALKAAGGATLTTAQKRAGERWARDLERRQLPAEVTKPKRGAKVLKGNRGVGPRPW